MLPKRHIKNPNHRGGQTYKNTLKRVSDSRGSGKSKSGSDNIGGFKWNLHRGMESMIPSIDIGSYSVWETETILDTYFKYCIENDEIPFRVITHQSCDKEKILRDIVKKYDMKLMVVNTQNLGCKTIVSGDF